MIPAVIPRVLLCAVFSWGILLLYARGWPLSSPILGSLVPSLVLGLLLVFRTNTSYERFWEGRKLWGNVVNLTRNLARQMWVAIETPQPGDLEAKDEAVRLLPAFAIAMKLHLRGELPNADLASLLSADQFAKLRQMNDPPLEIAFWVADYLQTQQTRGTLNIYQLTYCLETLDDLVDALGGCERILKTLIPDDRGTAQAVSAAAISNSQVDGARIHGVIPNPNSIPPIPKRPTVGANRCSPRGIGGSQAGFGMRPAVNRKPHPPIPISWSEC